MSTTNKFVYYNPCRKCSEPIDNALIGAKHNMCSTCAQMTYGVTDAGSSSGTKSKKPADADQSGGIGVTLAGGGQSGVGVTTDDQNEISGSRDDHIGERGHDYKGNGISSGIGVHTGDDSKQVNVPISKRRGRPATKKGPGGPKLTAACPKCKRAKVRCTHRRIIGDDSSNPVDVDLEWQEQQLLSPPKKKRTRIHLNVTDPENILDATSSEKKTRGTRKRKAAETEDTPYAIIEGTPIASADDPAAPKRRRGRKPKNAQPVVEINDSPIAISDSRIETPVPLSFPADSLEGAALLSRHVILSRELQQKLNDCDTKWIAAIKALEEAKEVLDTWVGVWRSGE